MKKTNTAGLRTNLKAYLKIVESGQAIEIQNRNLTVAKLVPIEKLKKNKTVLGSKKGSVEILGNITTPIMNDDWNMHQ